MIERTKEMTPFTAIRNRVLRSGMLSADEIGVYATMLSRPDSWEFSEWILARELNTTPKDVRTVLKRLEQKGFARERSGRKGAVWDLYEISNFMPGEKSAGEEALSTPQKPNESEENKRTMTNEQMARVFFEQAKKLRKMNEEAKRGKDCQIGADRV